MPSSACGLLHSIYWLETQISGKVRTGFFNNFLHIDHSELLQIFSLTFNDVPVCQHNYFHNVDETRQDQYSRVLYQWPWNSQSITECQVKTPIPLSQNPGLGISPPSQSRSSRNFGLRVKNAVFAGDNHLELRCYKLSSQEIREIFLWSNSIKSFAQCGIRTADP